MNILDTFRQITGLPFLELRAPERHKGHVTIVARCDEVNVYKWMFPPDFESSLLSTIGVVNVPQLCIVCGNTFSGHISSRHRARRTLSEWLEGSPQRFYWSLPACEEHRHFPLYFMSYSSSQHLHGSAIIYEGLSLSPTFAEQMDAMNCEGEYLPPWIIDVGYTPREIIRRNEYWYFAGFIPWFESRSLPERMRYCDRWHATDEWRVIVMSSSECDGVTMTAAR